MDHTQVRGNEHELSGYCSSKASDGKITCKQSQRMVVVQLKCIVILQYSHDG